MQHLLIVGDSGTGKSSFLRAVAGLWTVGTGHITRPPPGETFFLPQRPYCTLGTLREQLLYPQRPGLSATGAQRPKLSDEQLLAILNKVRPRPRPSSPSPARPRRLCGATASPRKAAPDDVWSGYAGPSLGSRAAPGGAGGRLGARRAARLVVDAVAG
jgi:energy-coupling factor transporter ATP-binding protein EcfA2